MLECSRWGLASSTPSLPCSKPDWLSLSGLSYDDDQPLPLPPDDDDVDSADYWLTDWPQETHPMDKDTWRPEPSRVESGRRGFCVMGRRSAK